MIFPDRDGENRGAEQILFFFELPIDKSVNECTLETVPGDGRDPLPGLLLEGALQWKTKEKTDSSCFSLFFSAE